MSRSRIDMLAEVQADLEQAWDKLEKVAEASELAGFPGAAEDTQAAARKVKEAFQAIENIRVFRKGPA